MIKSYWPLWLDIIDIVVVVFIQYFFVIQTQKSTTLWDCKIYFVNIIDLNVCVCLLKIGQARRWSACCKKARVDPCANLRDGASLSTDQSTSAVLLSGRDDLARYKANYDRHLSSGDGMQQNTQYCQRSLVVYNASRPVPLNLSVTLGLCQSHQHWRPLSPLSASKVEATELLRWGLRAGFLSCCWGYFKHFFEQLVFQWHNDTVLICVMTLKNMRKYAWLTKSTR